MAIQSELSDVVEFERGGCGDERREDAISQFRA
ncbi:MAG: hypothetical protein C5S47_01895 [Candidatus Methanogasteraceae archaeon]|nr:MAG: hypothetical protein C5S47_01895 [ANME-2 cluster archaeon]